VLFAVNTGLRPDEAWRLQFRDVTIVDDEDLRRRSWRSKCAESVGWILQEHARCGVAFERLRSRLRPARVYGANAPTGTSETSAVPNGQWRTPEPTDLIFPKWQRELFKTILDEENLRIDREGQPRTAYSLRHTYICLRLMEGADIYQIAKNCRTSVEMIEKYYAAHIKTSLDAAAINVMRPKKKQKQERQSRTLRLHRNLGSRKRMCKFGQRALS
jgi:integrase